MRALLFTLLASLAACAEPRGGRPEVTIYAASSLREPLRALAAPCGAAAGAAIVLNFGASDNLARQIEAAGRADVFLSADEATMDRLEAAGLIDAASRRSLLSNRLVAIVPSDDGAATAAFRPAELAAPQVTRVSLADPEAVPAGRYAKSWLVTAGLWEAVKDRVVPAVDARAAVAAVESGAAQAGVVFRTDAALTPRVRIAYEVGEAEGPPISYPIAALGGRPHHAAALAAVECLCGPEAAAAFREAGFIVLGPHP